MLPMAIDRRDFIAGMMGLAGSSALPAVSFAALTDEFYAAARKNPGGGYSAAIFNNLGVDVNSVTLPGRGHDLCVCPVTKLCVAFARRPGNFAVAFSFSRAKPPVWFTSPPDRHFYGHGVFSQDGRLLFTTENDFDGERGIIGIYDASAGFQRIGEFSAYGIGPHDIALMPDGQTLIVANGGIATHPDFGEGRLPLNLANMEPSLAYIDLKNGDLIERHNMPPAMHQISLRHLDIGAQDRIMIGCQTKHANRIDLPLIFSHRRGEDIKTVELDRSLSLSLRGYISSVAIDSSGEVAALTSSRGGRVVFLDVATGKLLGQKQVADISGVASGASAGDFLMTTGHGDVLRGFKAEGDPNKAETGWHWDNHAVKL